MKERSSPSSSVSEPHPGTLAGVQAGAQASDPGLPADVSTVDGFVSATHAVLANAEESSECDVCGEPCTPDDGEGYAMSGRAFFLSCRGGEAHFDERPLCAGCAAALGMTALARWEIEEEEG